MPVDESVIQAQVKIAAAAPVLKKAPSGPSSFDLLSDSPTVSPIIPDTDTVKKSPARKSRAKRSADSNIAAKKEKKARKRRNPKS